VLVADPYPSFFFGSRESTHVEGIEAGFEYTEPKQRKGFNSYLSVAFLDVLALGE